eukprot:scaffold94937_cov72-Phaeocystis_antarctica.AAC.3
MANDAAAAPALATENAVVEDGGVVGDGVPSADGRDVRRAERGHQCFVIARLPLQVRLGGRAARQECRSAVRRCRAVLELLGPRLGSGAAQGGSGSVVSGMGQGQG